MLGFKVLLVILVAAPTIAIAAVLFYKARSYSKKLNRDDKIRELASNGKQYRGYIDE